MKGQLIVISVYDAEHKLLHFRTPVLTADAKVNLSDTWISAYLTCEAPAFEVNDFFYATFAEMASQLYITGLISQNDVLKVSNEKSDARKIKVQE